MRRLVARPLVRGLVLSLVPAGVVEGLRLTSAAPFSLTGFLGRWLLAGAILIAAYRLAPVPVARRRAAWPWPLLAVLAAGALAGVAYGITLSTWAAWPALAGLYLALLAVAAAWERAGFVGRWLAPLALAAFAGAVPVAVAQLESHFAEEEFFVAVQAAALALFWLLLLIAARLMPPRERAPAGPGVRGWVPLAALLVAGAVTVVAVGRGYQASFYPASAPSYAGISAEQPFLCGQVEPDRATPAGEAVFAALLQQVEQNPRIGVVEYGMLALAESDGQWAARFGEAIMAEAVAGRYTEPAQSVKIGQYEAALRVYYYARVREAFPGLFSATDDAAVRAWFADVNRRALTVEWVDWLYGLAFRMWPEGPYENQENGAGLIALLRQEGLEAPELAAANTGYLARNPRGWNERFRNTDDALSYQPAWINNALFQMLAGGQVDAAKQGLSFEWLLLQSLPDGACLAYDHPSCYTLAKTAYLGAVLLDDPRFVWMADRALAAAARQGSAMGAQPGVEAAVLLTGASPTQGSCLLYGDSGLPNQVGPLAPDKIVFRDGWEPDSKYLMLNLRFTGWHRYKASNTVTLMYQGGAVAADALTGADFSWLPRGRSLFRDKRIPRENLNGLQVPRTGMSAVVYSLSGIGGRWAQDPPYYAAVVQFETLGALDVSRTVLEDWRGWRHERTIYFAHEGPVLIVDEADGQGAGVLTWHLIGDATREADSLLLGPDGRGSRLLWPAAAWPDLELAPADAVRAGQPNLDVTYRPSTSGSLSLATAWLTDAWAEGTASVTPVSDGTGYLVAADSGDGAFRLLANTGSGRIAAEGLATDGQAVLLTVREGASTICVVGGSEVSVPMAQPVARVLDAGATLEPGAIWEWRDGALLLHNGGVSRCVEARE